MFRWLVALALFDSVASGDPRVCKPDGSIIVEVDQRVDAGVKLPTSTTALYANGAWHTEVRDRDGQLARTSDGCIDSVRDILADLHAAPWVTKSTASHCHANSGRFTVYTWNRRVLYTERTCDASGIDTASRKVLDRIVFALHVPALVDAGIDCRNPLTRGCH